MCSITFCHYLNEKQQVRYIHWLFCHFRLNDPSSFLQDTFKEMVKTLSRMKINQVSYSFGRGSKKSGHSVRMYRISTLSEVFIQWKDLHVRIETPTARSAGGVSIRTSRSFYWMNIEDKVDIRLTHRIATLTVNVYRMESQIRFTR